MKPVLNDIVEVLSKNIKNRTVEISRDGGSVEVRVVDGKRMTWVDSNVLVRLHELTGGYTLVLKPDARLCFRPLTEDEKAGKS